MKIKKFFILNPKKLCLIVAVGSVSIILHNLVSGLTGSEEAFFFTLVIFVLPAYILIALLFTLINFFGKKRSK